MIMMVQFMSILVFLAISGVNSEASQNDGDVNIIKHPYMVSIRMKNEHICSGVIYNTTCVFTSDRCVPSFKHAWNVMNNMAIVAGTSTTKFGGQHIYVKETFSQNHYIDPTKNPVTSGVGVINLPELIKIGDSQPIELSPTEVPVGEKVQMIGWMIKNSQGNTTSNLKEVTLRVIDHQECQQFYEKNIRSYEFCTLPESPGNFCEGDHGSALIYKGKLVGLSTYGISCENPLIPDIHTNVNKMREYLKEIS